jgi:protocatechuate 3,4-dioxygenase beta subunit
LNNSIPKAESNRVYAMQNVRLLRCLSFLILVIAFPAAGQARPENDCGQTMYENHNQIDYDPLTVQKVNGTASDPSGTQIPGACIAIFSEKDQKLIAAVETDRQGKFLLPTIPPGHYRLVVKANPFCPANVELRVVKHQWKRRTLHAHMRVSGLDSCSFIDVHTQPRKH